MKLEMNIKILDVILATLAYKNYVIANNYVSPKQNFDWYNETKQYYNSLNLPNGMSKNNTDFESILDYGRNQELLSKLMATNLEDLNKYYWKNY